MCIWLRTLNFISLLLPYPCMKLRLAGTIKRLNVEHRTSNIDGATLYLFELSGSFSRHSCEACAGLDPVAGIQKSPGRSAWMPAFAGMTRETPRPLIYFKLTEYIIRSA